MSSFPQAMIEYKKNLERGYIQIAYQGLMDFFRDVKSYMESLHPEYSVSSSIYYGYMDMTYFAIFSETLKPHKLKIAIVFLHEAFKFEVWLSGSNRNIQEEYWKLFRDTDFDNFQLASDPRTADYIIRKDLDDNPDFGDLEKLIEKIESGTLGFIKEVENLLITQFD